MYQFGSVVGPTNCQASSITYRSMFSPGPDQRVSHPNDSPSQLSCHTLPTARPTGHFRFYYCCCLLFSCVVPRLVVLLFDSSCFQVLFYACPGGILISLLALPPSFLLFASVVQWLPGGRAVPLSLPLVFKRCSMALPLLFRQR